MRSDDAYLLDTLEAARKAQEFSAGLTESQFEQNELRQHAVFNVLEVVGEAASCVSEATRNAHPAIPWRRIFGLRNRIIHGYFDIDVGVIWRVVNDDLPKLISQLELVVPPEKK